MVSVEGLRRTGKYIRTIASRSVGLEYYQQSLQVNKIKKEIGHPNANAQIEQVLLSFFLTLVPAYMNFWEKEEYESSDAKIRPKFITGVKSLNTLLSALGVDLAPLVVPIVFANTTQHPLPLLGILAKPFTNAAVHVTSDLVDAHKFRRKDSAKADSGTYDTLDKIHDESYDPKLKSGVVRSSEGKVTAIVRKEEVCARTGGSCMELILPKTEGEERWIEFAHVTQKDIVVNTGSEKTPKTPPKIEELIEDLRNSLNQTESPALL